MRAEAEATEARENPGEISETLNDCELSIQLFKQKTRKIGIKHIAMN